MDGFNCSVEKITLLEKAQTDPPKEANTVKK